MDLLAFVTVRDEFAGIGRGAGGFVGIGYSANGFAGFLRSANGFAEIWHSARLIPSLWPIQANPSALWPIPANPSRTVAVSSKPSRTVTKVSRPLPHSGRSRRAAPRTANVPRDSRAKATLPWSRKLRYAQRPCRGIPARRRRSTISKRFSIMAPVRSSEAPKKTGKELVPSLIGQFGRGLMEAWNNATCPVCQRGESYLRSHCGSSKLTTRAQTAARARGNTDFATNPSPSSTGQSTSAWLGLCASSRQSGNKILSTFATGSYAGVASR